MSGGAWRAVAKGAGWSVRLHTSIDEVEASEWEILASPTDLQASHRFVRTCQHAGVEDAVYRHLLLYDRHGLAAVATLSFMRVALELLTTRGLRRTVQALRRRRPDLLRIPVLFCGLPVSFARPCLRLRDGVDYRIAIHIVAGIMEEVADELGADILCWKEFAPHEADALAPVTELGYFAAASLPTCRLRMRWGSFDAYVAAMRSGYRRQVRHALAEARRAGVMVTTVDDFGPDLPAIFGLYEQVMDRAEFQLERLNLRFFELLKQNFPAETRAVLARRSGTLVAAALLLDTDELGTFLLAGIDYAQHRECAAYLAVVTEVVAHAIERGVGWLEMGQTSYDLKRRLGAGTERRVLYLRHRRPLAHRVLRLLSPLVFPDRPFPPRRVFRQPE